ncbi:SCO family protein [Pontibacter harenae]|uniref:SCO family protein n=1 Tax=Pontibacter harenae TaxID=2894083 RepID=UPI001E531BD4|nr:SCO family protein [Pontibacter harenae]MCC9166130.1 SCO family protein [Pontibacter harenae]
MNNKKALILGLLLLVPLLFIVVSGVFDHHFSLRTYFPELTDEGEVVYNAEGDTIFRQLPDFKLISQEGDTVTQQTFSDDIYVADFFFATCPDVCKKMSSQLSRIQEAFESNPDVKIASFTVNPEHDSVEVLQNYAAMYGAKPDKWYFLTGEKEEIYSLAIKGFFLPVQDLSGEDFVHSEKFMLVDRNRRVRGIYDGTNPVEVDRLITEINVLLDEYSKGE